MHYSIFIALALTPILNGCAMQSGSSSHVADPGEQRLLLSRSIPTSVPFGSVYEVRVYIVTRGDTSSKIAERFHLTIDQLAALNPDLRPSSDKRFLHLKVGQRLVVYEKVRD